MLSPALGFLRRHRLPTALAAVVVLVTAGLLTVHYNTRRIVYTGDGGPIPGIDGLVREGVAIDTPEQRTWGSLALPNRNDAPIVIESFRVIPPLGGGFRFLGSAVAADPDREALAAGAFPGYPNPDWRLGPLSRPLAGTVIPPHSDRGVALVIGMEITRDGVFWWDRIDVDFRYKGRDYTVKNNLGLYFCAPTSAFPDGCRPHFEDHPREICDNLGYVPLGDNGCIPKE